MTLTEELLKLMVEKNASDLHIHEGEPPFFRVDGDLKRLKEYEIMNKSNIESCLDYLLTKEERNVFENNGEVDLAYELAESARYRINAYKQKGRTSIAIRRVPIIIQSIKELYLPQILTRLARKDSGLILVTGPTGSGKSTTLAAIINEINEKLSRHIVTLENPIEMVHSNKKSLIEQREVGRDTGSFESGMRAVLRQDPDIIMVGELRDKETISAAITAAETGHLVLGTLHTRTAASTINRIIDVFPEVQQDQIREQLSQSLVSVISQRLVKKLDGGRVALTEIMINNAAIGNMIKSKKTGQINMVIETSNGIGMMNMKKAAEKLIEQGLIDELMVSDIFIDADKTSN